MAKTVLYTRMLGVQFPCTPKSNISNSLEDCKEYLKGAKKQEIVIRTLVEVFSIRSIERMTGVDRDTIQPTVYHINISFLGGTPSFLGAGVSKSDITTITQGGRGKVPPVLLLCTRPGKTIAFAMQ